MEYPNLEPNHSVFEEDGMLIVVCPFEQTEAIEDVLGVQVGAGVMMHDHPVTETATFSMNAAPEEIGCPVCWVFSGELHFAGPPTHSDPPDDVELIAGGAPTIRHYSSYTPCRVPLRRITWCGVSILVHEGWVARLMKVDHIYWQHVTQGEQWRIRQGDTAFYVCRHIAGSSRWSTHSIAAGDINWNTNPQHSDRCDHPIWFRDAMKSRSGGAGAGHGLDWTPRYRDGMHYSLAPNEGGDGLFYVGEGEEADDMTPEQEAKLDKAISLLEEKEGGKTYEHLDILENKVTALASHPGKVLTFNDNGTVATIDGVPA